MPFHPLDRKKLAEDMKADSMSFRFSVWDDKKDSKIHQYKLVPKPENAPNDAKVYQK